jgi:hypothetical protein
MRSYVSRSIVVGACLLTAVIAAGCEAKQATEYVAGISTQVTVPRDLKAIRIDVAVGGFRTFCQGYKVYDGKVQLPRSLGAFATSNSAVSGAPITYTVAGVSNGDIDAGFFLDCDLAKVGKGDVRVLRRSRQPYIPDEIRFLPMPIKYACWDKDCGEEETCKGGKCVPAALSLEQAKEKFPPFSPDLVDGTGGTCFSASLCMGLGAAALTVDPETCTYALVNGKDEPPRAKDAQGNPVPSPFPPLPIDPSTGKPPPWDGLNVEVTYDGGLNKEILDLDPEEGFVYAGDPQTSQRFKLSPGLCEMVKGRDDKGQPTLHRITAVRASGTCQPKRLAQPICAADQLAQMGVDPGGLASNPTPPNDCSPAELKSPRAALLVVVDNTSGHQAFFNPDELKAVEFPLKDPAFERTDIGLSYAHAASCATNAEPAVALEPSRDVRQKIIDSIGVFAADKTKLFAGGPEYEGALVSAYAKLTALPDTYFRRAVIVLGNRDFDVDQCSVANTEGSVIDVAKRARENNPLDANKPINTYVIQLAKTKPEDQPSDPLAIAPGLIQLAEAGAGSPIHYNPDARGTKKNAKDSFQQVINSLATCVYDVDDDLKAPGAEDSVSFNDPLLGAVTKVPANTACNTDDVPGTGWGYGGKPPAGKKRIYLCQDSCTKYRDVLAQASDFALIYQQPPIAVPIFAHKKACEPK